MADIDPVEFGAVQTEVSALRREVNEMRGDIKALLALANRSQGGFWMGIAIASFLGGIATWFADRVFRG